jgi:hypothetical protein
MHVPFAQIASKVPELELKLKLIVTKLRAIGYIT